MKNCSQLLEKLRKFYHYFKNFEYILLNIILHLARGRGGVLKVDDVTGIKLCNRLRPPKRMQIYTELFGPGQNLMTLKTGSWENHRPIEFE